MPHEDLVVFSEASCVAERVGDHRELVEARLIIESRMYLAIENGPLDDAVVEDVKTHLAESLTREDHLLVGDEECLKMLVHESAFAAVEFTYDARLIERIRRNGTLARLFAEINEAEPSDKPGFPLEGRCPSCALRGQKGLLRFNPETGKWWCSREDMGGDAIDFHAVLHRVERWQARARLALELGITEWPFGREAGTMEEAA